MQVSIEGNELVIRVPVNSLETAFEYCPHAQKFDPETSTPPRVTDLDQFAEEIVSILQMEREDGSTYLTDAFDKAFVYAIEYGVEGIE